MKYALTLSIVFVLTVAGQAIADNATSFHRARLAALSIERLVRDGPTDTDCLVIEHEFDVLAKLRGELTEAQQSVLWHRYPYMSGIACSRAFAHSWVGNDCQYQCGTLGECQGETNEKY
jgi:hypothetical protein